MLKRLSVSIVMALLTMALPWHALARTMQLSDVRTIVDVNHPRISPDGTTIVCIVTRPRYAENDYVNDLVLIDVASRAQHLLVHDVKDLGSPIWSPHGDRIAYIAAAAAKQDGDTDQIFAVSASGGTPQQLSHAPEGVDSYAWRPDGATIAYDAADEPANAAAIAQHHDEFEVHNDGFLISAAPTPVNLWLLPTNGGNARPLTHGSGMVFGGDAGTQLSWSPDATRIAITWAPTPHLGDTNAAVAMIVDARTGHMRRLTHHTSFENYPTFSPDGTQIAYWWPLEGDNLNGTEAYVTSAAGGDGTDVTRALDRDVSSVQWMPGGKTLLVTAPTGVRIGMWLQPIGGRAQRIPLGDVDPSWDNWTDVDVGKTGAIVFAGSEPKRPAEVYYLRSPFATLRRLTDFGHDIAALDLGRSAEVTWHYDGFLEDGIITYPPHFDPSRKYPLVLRIHGGPNYMYPLAFWDFRQLEAARGWVVFEPNYRGSDNLGSAYEHLIFNDGVAGPGRDIMAGVHAVEQLGFIDRQREAVGGHSYGGYMAAWLTTQSHRWKAAVIFAGELDPLAQYYLEDYNVAEWVYFKARPWNDPAAMQEYVKQSALTYVTQVSTPTLILSNTGDGRVPVAPEFAWYHALSDRGVPVKFVLFPGSGHDISGPVHVEDSYRLWLDWIAR